MRTVVDGQGRVNTMSDEGDELIIATHDSLPRKAREPKTCSGTRRDDPPSAFACDVAEISTHKRNSKNTRRRAALNSRVLRSRPPMTERGRTILFSRPCERLAPRNAQ